MIFIAVSSYTANFFLNSAIVTQSPQLDLDRPLGANLSLTSKRSSEKNTVVKENHDVTWVVLLKEQMKSTFFVKILVYVVFGTELTDKQTLLFGTALTKIHLASMAYCKTLMSQQVLPKA